MIYREMKQRLSDELGGAGIEFAEHDAWMLMEYACGIDRSFYLLHQTDELPASQEKRLLELSARRAAHVPLQHLTGEQEFMGLPFWVSDRVLIPRQDTELLVEEALRVIPEGRSARVLDLCTGSGCIAVSLKVFRPEADVTGSDLSKEALQIARLNCMMNEAEISLEQGDLFAGRKGKFDVIVSNPPYIPTDIIPTLMPEVREHEPISALDGHEDGLYFYQKIIKESPRYLSEHGYLLFEIGYDQGEAVTKLMREHGFEQIAVVRDLAGLDRVVKGQFIGGSRDV